MAKIGVVSHYFPKISVAALTLSGGLKIGDNVKIAGHGKEFTQLVDSMQVEHVQVESAKKGDNVAIKVSQPAHEGDGVEKI